MLLLFAAFLILLNGFFVAAEFALVKVRSTQLDALVQQGNTTAKVARHIVRHLNPYLSATQLGITLASLGLGWVGEPALAHLLEPLFIKAGIVNEQQMHWWATAIAFVIISFLHIVVGEVAPKSIALAKAEGTSLFVALPMRLFYYLFYPFLWVLEKSSNALLRLFGIDAAASGHSAGITAEELYHITAQSTAEGAIEAGQGELLSNVLSFSDRVAREIMVPRGRVVYLQVTHTLPEAMAIVVQSGKTRFPLVDGNMDNVVGVIHMKDLLPYLMEQRPLDSLRNLSRKVIYVPENMPAQKLLLEFQRTRSHFAIVVDEYGGLSGVATMEDALEELVGEIQDEFDVEIQPILEIENGYSVDGGLLMTDLTHQLKIRELDTEADTVGGFVMEQLSRIPEAGDEVGIPGWQLKVQRMDGLRVARVEVLQRPETAEEAEA